jgi:soluble lytic murein transglycosylase-like protein
VAGNADIIKEFLVSLGFKVDETQFKRFDVQLGKTQKDVLAFGKTLFGVATALEAMVEEFASSMEKLYYASQRTGASASSLQALESGAQRIGLQAGQATGALTGMVQAMRLNPGLEALLRGSLGVRSNDTKMLLDLVGQLRTMPFYQAAQFAQLFGIDPETLRAMEQNYEQLLQAERDRQALNERAGVQTDKLAHDSTVFMNALRDLWDTLKKVGEQVLAFFLPPAMAVLKVVQGLVNGFLELNKATAGWAGALGAVVSALYSIKALGSVLGRLLGGRAAATVAGGAATAAAGGSAGAGFWASLFNPLTAGLSALFYSKGLNGGEEERLAELQRMARTRLNGEGAFRALEDQFGLPPGLLASTRRAESGGNDRAVSPVGAAGPFQFMAGTAARYGITDRFDLDQSSRGAAHYFHDLLTMFGGDVAKAVAAYNWGEGNVQRTVRQFGAAWAQHLPAETTTYLGRVLGGMSPAAPLGAGDYLAGGGSVAQRGGRGGGASLTQHTTIRVDGAGDPAAVAREVAGQQSRVNGDLVRNLRPAVQ